MNKLPDRCARSRFPVAEPLLVLICVLIYLPSFGVPFLWDDRAIIIANPPVQNGPRLWAALANPLTAYTSTFYRPLQILTHALEFKFLGYNPVGYHVLNILLHCTASVLLMRLGMRLRFSREASFWGALIFAVCPLWVETVAYISGRADSLLAVAAFAAILCFLSGRLAGSVFWFVLALLSKEAALVIPLVAVALWRADPQERVGRRRIFFLWCLCIVGYLLLRWQAVGREGLMVQSAAPLGERLLASASVFGRYFAMLLAPVNQHMSYVVSGVAHRPLESAASLLFGSILLFSTFFLRHRPRLRMAGSWVLLWMLPYAGLVPGNAVFAEHFFYIGAGAVFLLGAQICFSILGKRFARILLVCLVCGYAVAAVRYIGLWRDPARLYERIILASPGSIDGYNNLGVLFMEQGATTQAETLFQAAHRAVPQALEPLLNLARLAYLRGDYPEAERLLVNVLRRDPFQARARNFLGAVYARQGTPERALESFLEAVRLNPRLSELRFDLWRFYRQTQAPQKAEEVLRELAARDPAGAFVLLAKETANRIDAGLFDDALETATSGAGLFPRSPVFLALRASAYRGKGFFPQAIAEYGSALKIDPAYVPAYNGLGVLYAAQKEYAQARASFEKALSVHRNYADALSNLAVLDNEERASRQKTPAPKNQ